MKARFRLLPGGPDNISEELQLFEACMIISNYYQIGLA